MERIAIYGKGGIGKSVVATNLSVAYARRGRKVLHIGCDPKHDSSMRLMDVETELATVLDTLGDNPCAVKVSDIINTGRLGIDCCEAGGPSPGVGCAGRGVARTLEFLEDTEILEGGRYDVAMFDVLGDVVCGGFAAPLRAGFAQKIFIVTSEEPMSLYAANNICKAINTYASNDIVLGGLIANLRSDDADREQLKMFADIVNTRILAFIPKEKLIVEAELAGRTLMEYAPESETAQLFEKLMEEIAELDVRTVPLPTPLSHVEFRRFAESARGGQL